MKKIISVIMSIVLILANITISLRYHFFAESELIFALGMDGYLDSNGTVRYQFGIGSASQICIFLILLVSIICILFIAKIFYKDKYQRRIYIFINIILAVIMYVFWGVYYLDYYPLTGNLTIHYM